MVAPLMVPVVIGAFVSVGKQVMSFLNPLLVIEVLIMRKRL
jgi:hypothetical protein